jgi:hypothetical protein
MAFGDAFGGVSCFILYGFVRYGVVSFISAEYHTALAFGVV